MNSQNYSFVVRVWLESTYSDEKSALWRGSIEQVGSNCRFYFSDLEGITRFIQSQIEQGAAPPPSESRVALELIKDGFRKLWKRFLRRTSK